MRRRHIWPPLRSGECDRGIYRITADEFEKIPREPSNRVDDHWLEMRDGRWWLLRRVARWESIKVAVFRPIIQVRAS